MTAVEFSELTADEQVEWANQYLQAIRRDAGGSRGRIIARLERAKRTLYAKEVLKQSPNTWSEDLQELVREGLVRSDVEPNKMGPNSLVWVGNYGPWIE